MANGARRVLIVDDAEDIRNSVAEVLESEGYFVSCAGNGHDALQALTSAEPLPDLILLDLMMPDMDGREFRARQLAHVQLAGIPVVLMSAGGNLKAQAEALRAQGYLRKPFRDIDQIVETVGRLCRS
jgi:CheY-like chemotaxis protein